MFLGFSGKKKAFLTKLYTQITDPVFKDERISCFPEEEKQFLRRKFIEKMVHDALKDPLQAPYIKKDAEEWDGKDIEYDKKGEFVL